MPRLPTATSAVPCTVSTVTTQVVTNLQRMPTARVDAPTLHFSRLMPAKGEEGVIYLDLDLQEERELH